MHSKGGKLVSIDVYYRSDRGAVRIIKSENDKDARWSGFLHSYSSHAKGSPSRGDRTWEDLHSPSGRQVNLGRKESSKETGSRGSKENLHSPSGRRAPIEVALSGRRATLGREESSKETESLSVGKRPLEGIGLTRSETIALAVIGGTSAYISWDYIKKSKKYGRKS